MNEVICCSKKTCFYHDRWTGTCTALPDVVDSECDDYIEDRYTEDRYTLDDLGPNWW